MLVIKKPRGGGTRTYQYGGSGIFDAIGRKMFSSGLKKAISRGAQSVLGQKVADAVVKGALTATEKAAHATLNEAINTLTPYVKESLQKVITGKKRPVEKTENPNSTPPTNTAKIAKLDINSLIDGSGIVFD